MTWQRWIKSLATVRHENMELTTCKERVVTEVLKMSLKAMFNEIFFANKFLKLFK